MLLEAISSTNTPVQINGCTYVQVLNLSSIDLTEEHITGLEYLSGALAANPSIDQVDLDCNFFGAQILF
jgi:hypothetical protein